MEHRIGQRVYSEDNECWYRIVKGRPNSCRGCAFLYDDDGEDACDRPYDLGEEEACDEEAREDGMDIIYKEL